MNIEKPAEELEQTLNNVDNSAASQERQSKHAAPVHIKHGHMFVHGYIGLVLLAVFAGLSVDAYKQHDKVKYLDSQNNNLSVQVKQLKTSNSGLKSKDDTLSKSIQALTSAQAKAAKPSAAATVSDSNTTTTPVAGASLTINKVQILTPSYFGNTAPDATTDQVRVVFVTMKNLTSSPQTYSVLDFSATTNTGVIVKPRVYAGAGMGTIWNNSTLAPGGTISQPLLFDEGDNIVTLQWSPSGSSTISLPIPSVPN